MAIDTTSTFRSGLGSPRNIRLFKGPIAAERIGGVKAAPGGIKMAGGFAPGGGGFAPKKKGSNPPGMGPVGLKPSGWIGPAPMSEASGGHVPSSATSAAAMGGAVGGEHGNSKSYGIDQGDQDNPHSYLGHFANDNVLAVGHNVGHKKKGGQAAVIGMAKKGYRKIPGTASVHQGNTSHGSLPDSAHGLPPSRSERAKATAEKRKFARVMKGLGASMAMPAPSMPPVSSDKRMSVRHHEDSIRFNKKHAADHEAAAKKHERELRSVRKSKPPKG
jgi:hypothetical protein